MLCVINAPSRIWGRITLMYIIVPPTNALCELMHKLGCSSKRCANTYTWVCPYIHHISYPLKYNAPHSTNGPPNTKVFKVQAITIYDRSKQIIIGSIL